VDLTAVVRPLGLTPTLQLALASVLTMLLLALLDFVGAVFAKEWADTRNPLWFAAGLTAFVILFAFYAGSLKTAELSIVTIGWVVFLQVGLVLYERFRYDAELAPAKWAAIALVLALQAYLMLTPNQQRAADVAVSPMLAEVSSISEPQ
jgi:multidrug transporter EmrE-like cation transporter